jgi:DNA gyrase/topoisomerase IV subunit B
MDDKHAQNISVYFSIFEDVYVLVYNMTTTDENFVVSDMRDHVRNKSMWAGSIKKTSIPSLMGMYLQYVEDSSSSSKQTSGDAANEPPSLIAVYKFTLIDRDHSPALLKIIDEIIVNATDFAMINNRGNKVTMIIIKFNKLTGEISVYNDGPGIPVVVHEAQSKAEGKTVYIPEVAFGRYLAGTNINKNVESISGGINGLGAKLTFTLSTLAYVETYDGNNHKLYIITYRNGYLDKAVPIITSIKGLNTHTFVRFTPDYKHFGYGDGTNVLTSQEAEDIDCWIRMRAVQSAVYVGSKTKITYNDEFVSITSTELLARTIINQFSDPSMTACLTAVAKSSKYTTHPWSCTIIMMPPGVKIPKVMTELKTVAIVNGVVSLKGSHVRYFRKMICDSCAPKVKKATKSESEMTPAEVTNSMCIIIAGSIPCADWTGQRKDELSIPNAEIETYKFTDAFMKTIATEGSLRILQTQTTAVSKKQAEYKKYTEADKAGDKKQKSFTTLLVAEGDSALGLIQTGLQLNNKEKTPGSMSTVWCGTFSLQGVTLNAMREFKNIGGLLVRSAKLDTNVRLNAFMQAVGLSYNKKYTSADEIATLNYGRIVITVDQDVDGAGKIAPNFLAWLMLFWPALIQSGFVCRLLTPVIRGFSVKNKKEAPLVFYYESDHKRWLKENSLIAGNYTFSYYKGLASHDDADARIMFAPIAFKQAIYKYTITNLQEAERLFNVYYGDTPALRKEELRTPVKELTAEELNEIKTKLILPIERVQLCVESKTYKLAAIARQLPNVIDGMTIAKRKALTAAFKKFKDNKAIKVFQLGGYCADVMFYHHSADSINDTIIRMAQSFHGAMRYPYLLGVGQFGDRHTGVAGSSRYVSVQKNTIMPYIFRNEDKYVLEYTFEENERAEPKYYVPVLPMCVLESFNIPSEGWKHTSYALDLKTTMFIVNKYIAGNKEYHDAADDLCNGFMEKTILLAAKTLIAYSNEGYTGSIRMYKGEMYSFGKYYYNEVSNQVIITDLPIGVKTESYIESLDHPDRMRFIKKITTAHGMSEIEIRLQLNPGAFELITTHYGSAFIDPIEDAFMLRESLGTHLNYYSPDEERFSVLEYSSLPGAMTGYLAAILHWCHYRKLTYVKRITRLHLLAKLKYIELEQIMRYVHVNEDLGISKIEDETVAYQTLSNLQFIKLYSTIIHKPEYHSNEEICSLFYGEKSNYNYLLHIRDVDKFKNMQHKRQMELIKLQQSIDEYNALLNETPFPCASLWKTESAEAIAHLNIPYPKLL